MSWKVMQLLTHPQNFLVVWSPRKHVAHSHFSHFPYPLSSILHDTKTRQILVLMCGDVGYSQVIYILYKFIFYIGLEQQHIFTAM